MEILANLERERLLITDPTSTKTEIGELIEDMTGKIRFAKYTFLNGAYYEGVWESGIFNGYGIHLLPSGHKYQGQWQKGLR